MQHHQLVIGRGAQRIAVAGHGVCLADDTDALAAWSEVAEAVVDRTSTHALGELVRLGRRMGTDRPHIASAAAVEIEGGLLVVLVGAAAATRSGPDRPEVVRAAGGEPGVLVASLGARTAIGLDLDTRSGAEALATGAAPDRGVLIVPTVAEVDDDDRTRRRERRPADGGPTVLGARCPLGHLNAPTWALCRSCGEGLSGSPLVVGVRPSLGVLTLSDGQTVELWRSVVVGRRPAAASHDGRRECETVSVTSPEKVVSRTHFEVSVIDWELRLIDRGSHNGTRLHRPHSRDLVLHEGQSASLEVGDVITFGDMSARIGASSAGAGSQ